MTAEVDALGGNGSANPGKARPARRPASWIRKYELPTWGLIFLDYGLWISATYFWQLSPIAASIAGAFALALFMHIQHEVIHGHPTRNILLNELLVSLPITIWLPYRSYRVDHLRHHMTGFLTDPLDDTESYYLTKETWERLPAPLRKLYIFHNSLLGRLLLGPAIGVSRYLWGQVRLMASGNRKALGMWAIHLIGAGIVYYWVTQICGMPFWVYLAAIVYPGTSIALIRSFAEHRPAENQEQRTAIVEDFGFFGYLFLFNNLHAVHHEKPGLCWFDIPARYRADRDRYLAMNGGYLFRSYGDVFRKHFLKPRDIPVHPGY